MRSCGSLRRIVGGNRGEGGMGVSISAGTPGRAPVTASSVLKKRDVDPKERVVYSCPRA